MRRKNTPDHVSLTQDEDTPCTAQSSGEARRFSAERLGPSSLDPLEEPVPLRLQSPQQVFSQPRPFDVSPAILAQLTFSPCSSIADPGTRPLPCHGVDQNK